MLVGKYSTLTVLWNVRKSLNVPLASHSNSGNLSEFNQSFLYLDSLKLWLLEQNRSIEEFRLLFHLYLYKTLYKPWEVGLRFILYSEDLMTPDLNDNLAL